MVEQTPSAWSASLAALARPVLIGTPWEAVLGGGGSDPAGLVGSFCDELGHRRAVDRFVLGRLVGCEPEPPGAGASVDVQLWASACGGRADVPGVIDPAGDGPLIAIDAQLGIELWTQRELASLHALWWIARRDDGWVDRLDRALRWHVRSIQPDNATGHPWAVCAFIDLWWRTGDGDAQLHAQQLVHTTLIARGVPDRFSALLLIDAAGGLDLVGSMPRPVRPEGGPQAC